MEIPVPPSTEFSDSEGSGRAGPSRREREARGSAPEQEDPPRRGRRRSRPEGEQETGKGKGKSKRGGKKGKKGSKEGRSGSGGKKGEKGDGKKGKRQEPQPDMRTIIQQEMAKMIPMAASMLGMMNPVSLNPMAMGSAGPSTGLTHASTEAAPKIGTGMGRAGGQIGDPKKGSRRVPISAMIVPYGQCDRQEM